MNNKNIADRWKYAVQYCENHECQDCIIYINNLDIRTEEEYLSHIPCCKNIYDYLTKNNLDQLY